MVWKWKGEIKFQAQITTTANILFISNEHLYSNDFHCVVSCGSVIHYKSNILDYFHILWSTEHFHMNSFCAGFFTLYVGKQNDSLVYLSLFVSLSKFPSPDSQEKYSWFGWNNMIRNNICPFIAQLSSTVGLHLSTHVYSFRNVNTDLSWPRR